MKLKIHLVDHLLKDTFQTAHSKRDIQQSVIVELTEQGTSGYGEATANTYFGITRENIIDRLEKVRGLVENYDWGFPHDLYSKLSVPLHGSSFPLCALDEASYDLYGKLSATATYNYLGLTLNDLPVSDYTIGIDTIEVMVEKINAVQWPVYKIKLGTGEDIKIVKELRKHTNAAFRVDANCGWTADEAIENAFILAELGVEFIEQPLPKEDFKGMKKVFKYSALPVIADESCMVEADLDKCIGYFHGINIKLTKCGGITPALRMIRQAEKYSLKVMMGCMTESSVGVSAAAQLLPLLDYADLDGAMLISNDPANGVRLIDGRVIFPKTFGNGVIMKPEFV